MLRPRTRCSPSTAMLWPWTAAEAMLETVVVVALYLGPLLANSVPDCRPMLHFRVWPCISAGQMKEGQEKAGDGAVASGTAVPLISLG